jgi:hypothetical protein
MSDVPKPLQVDELKPGDVLLHMGTGELSKLIAWVGDSAYSHAALVIDNGQLIEAAASGVRHAGLVERTDMRAHFHFVDVYRPERPGANDGKDRTALLDSINAYLGRPYPMTSLLTLGIACTVRNKVPGDPKLRQFVRMALDLVIANDSSHVVCSELIYRGFDEAATQPMHLLRLRIVTRPVQGTPLPRIDLGALLKESLDDYKRSLPKSRKAITSNAAGEDDFDVEALLLQARDRLGLGTATTSSMRGHAPNPKTVLPADLEFSPGLKRIGRLVMRS